MRQRPVPDQPDRSRRELAGNDFAVCDPKQGPGAPVARVKVWRRVDEHDFPMVDVLRLKALPQWRLWLRFTDGAEGEYDLKSYVHSGGTMLEPLKDPAFFARAFVELGAPTWPNGFDLDPIKAYMDLRDAGLLKRAEPDRRAS